MAISFLGFLLKIYCGSYYSPCSSYQVWDCIQPFILGGKETELSVKRPKTLFGRAFREVPSLMRLRNEVISK